MAKTKKVAIKRGPHKHKQFFSLRSVRVANTSGYCVQIAANTPTELPEPLWPDAFRAGCMEFDAKLIKAAADAIKAHAGKPPAAAGKPTKRDNAAIVRQAVQEVLESGDPGAVTKVGVPKLSAVRARVAKLGGASEGLTSDAIYDIFVELQDSQAEEAAEETTAQRREVPDESGLADSDGIDEIVGGGVDALLSGENAGGDEDNDD